MGLEELAPYFQLLKGRNDQSRFLYPPKISLCIQREEWVIFSDEEKSKMIFSSQYTPTTAEHFFLRIHGTYMDKNHMLGHKEDLK